jgi:hypothetical protein
MATIDDSKRFLNIHYFSTCLIILQVNAMCQQQERPKSITSVISMKTNSFFIATETILALQPNPS